MYVLQREYLGDGLRMMGMHPNLEVIQNIASRDAGRTLNWFPGDWYDLSSDMDEDEDVQYHIHQTPLLEENSILPKDEGN